MTNQISTQTISFNNQSLITLEQNGTHYTAMKPICENIGLDWKSQFARIKRDEILSQGVVIITIPSNGGDQQMICLPIEYLNGWLFGIDVKRCKPEIRETLIKYKKECYQALHDYWFKGKAERKTTVDQRTGLRNAVNMLVGKKALMYNEAYNLVHQRFNVESIEDLTAEQLPQAVEYIHKIYLEGELIIDEPKTNNDIQISADVFEAIMKHTRLAKRLAEQVEPFHRQLHQMLGLERWQKNDIASLAYGVRAEFNYWLDEGEKLIEKYRREKAEINYANARLRKATA